MTTKKLKTIAFESDPAIMRQIDEYCRQEGISRSLFLRKAAQEKIVRITTLPRPDVTAHIVPVYEVAA